MTHIFNLENFDDFSERINMDELYEKKKQHDLDQLTLYNKILNRIHVKIKTTSRQNTRRQNTRRQKYKKATRKKTNIQEGKIQEYKYRGRQTYKRTKYKKQD